MRKHMTVALAAMLVAAGCSQDPTGVSSNELVLAQQAQLIAQDVAASSEATHEGWLRRLFAALRDTDDPEAQACLAEARDLREQQLRRESFLKVLCAVIEVFPNAPERTGLAVDQAIVRIETFLGGRDAPRIRRVLAHVKELRADADRALAAGEKVTALALNLRSIQILHRLVEHIRDAHGDHDVVADSEMEAVNY
ncbi:MAG TPA: hypothetical protein VK573_00995 [Gemmatimonadales bacterium]|nr:hypothetical protein [Gemmatimonadales bacterium]